MGRRHGHAATRRALRRPGAWTEGSERRRACGQLGYRTAADVRVLSLAMTLTCVCVHAEGEIVSWVGPTIRVDRL